MTPQRERTNAPCSVCGQGTLTQTLVEEAFTFDMGEESVEVRAHDVPVQRCNHCGEELSGPEAARVRHEAVCKAAGLYTPGEIRALRNRLGLTQEEFARLAGVGVATVSRWERGRLLQNRGYNNILLLLDRSPEARRILQEALTGPGRREE